MGYSALESQSNLLPKLDELGPSKELLFFLDSSLAPDGEKLVKAGSITRLVQLANAAKLSAYAESDTEFTIRLGYKELVFDDQGRMVKRVRVDDKKRQLITEEFEPIEIDNFLNRGIYIISLTRTETKNLHDDQPAELPENPQINQNEQAIREKNVLRSKFSRRLRF